MTTTEKIVVGFTVLFVLFLVAASVVSIYREGAFLVPGLAPASFKEGQPVPLFVNKVTSAKAPIPFRYHDLPVCTPPEGELESRNSNLGDIITGSRIETSVYSVRELLTPIPVDRPRVVVNS